MLDPAARPYTDAASSNVASSKQGGASENKVQHAHISCNERLKWGTQQREQTADSSSNAI